MANDLTDGQIAMLCNIGEYDMPKLTDDRKRDLDRLLSDGYIEPTVGHPGSAFKLTAKGTALLGMRGAGLNEA